MERVNSYNPGARTGPYRKKHAGPKQLRSASGAFSLPAACTTAQADTVINVGLYSTTACFTYSRFRKVNYPTKPQENTVNYYPSHTEVSTCTILLKS